jgi:hypothetical protein
MPEEAIEQAVVEVLEEVIAQESLVPTVAEVLLEEVIEEQLLV